MHRSHRIEPALAAIDDRDAGRTVAPQQVERDRDCRTPSAEAKYVAIGRMEMIRWKEFIERLAGGNRIGRLCAEHAAGFGEARRLTAKIGAFVDRVEEVPAGFEEVDLMGRDQGSTRVFIALDALNQVSIQLARCVDRQVGAGQPPNLHAKLIRPGWKQPRGPRLSRCDANEVESVPGASSGDRARRATGMFAIRRVEKLFGPV